MKRIKFIQLEIENNIFFYIFSYILLSLKIIVVLTNAIKENN